MVHIYICIPIYISVSVAMTVAKSTSNNCPPEPLKPWSRYAPRGRKWPRVRAPFKGSARWRLYIYICIYTYVNLHEKLYEYVSMYVYVYIYMHVYIYIYT